MLQWETVADVLLFAGLYVAHLYLGAWLMDTYASSMSDAFMYGFLVGTLLVLTASVFGLFDDDE